MFLLSTCNPWQWIGFHRMFGSLSCSGMAAVGHLRFKLLCVSKIGLRVRHRFLAFY